MEKITTLNEFRIWVKVQLVLQGKTQRTLAEEMGIAYPRISEAIHGKKTAKKYIKKIIKELDGNIEDFEELFCTLNLKER